MKKQIVTAVGYAAYVKPSDESNLWVSYCPVLDIKSQGTTTEEALDSLDDAVLMFVRYCHRVGILEDQLKALGLSQCERIEGAQLTRPDGDADLDRKIYIYYSEEKPSVVAKFPTGVGMPPGWGMKRVAKRQAEAVA